MRVINTVSPERAERFHEETPERAEATAAEHRRINARLIARQRQQRAFAAAVTSTSGSVVPVPAARVSRPRERRARRTGASSRTSSADPGSADSDPEPPIGPGWRWASDASWRNFVKSIHSRDLEREVYLERMRGVAR